eukprot:CAMPEP_0196996416 /NCGR_PEP_ID=MMETSP1380-20130617/2295_1 /TAXON_ID=5936 /ORGANISM="Euplotes crassus, Strain CT5" /LENGTH=209 /DNA_ID=CAMNT_0042412361 /DNA_START=163 /DNA_END=792 /DNA_ORIENTATION=+
MSVKYYDYGVEVDIDHLPAGSSCVLQFENLGNYSSSLRFNRLEYHNIEAYVFETDAEKSFFEPRGKFNSLQGDELSKNINDFHIWQGNTSLVVLTTDDAYKGPAVFKAIVEPLPAPEEDIPHIEDYFHHAYPNPILFASIFTAVTILLCLASRTIHPGNGFTKRMEESTEREIGYGQIGRKGFLGGERTVLDRPDELGETGYKIISVRN